jgi:glycosyltransferase involved in cell wall biosynthesis
MAWLGPAPTAGFGVPDAARLVLAALADAGVEVDAFMVAAHEELPPALRGRPGLRLVVRRPVWLFGEWYEPPAAATFVVSQSARAAGQALLVRRIAERHRARPYDALYQFSQLELLTARAHLSRLPPLVLHPQVHAAGELEWHRREAALSRRCEPASRRALARALLAARARLQRGDVARARRIVVPSAGFGALLARDYGVPAARIRVVPDPVDLERFSPPPALPPQLPVRLLFVSRIAVRKGVEMVVELSRRLRDLEGRVRIDVIGGGGGWSDYRPLLDGLDPAVAQHLGELGPAAVADAMRGAHGLLQPSHYEPFALTVAEGLASGLPVVASDAVGAAEGVDRRCCRVFPAGDADAFEAAVRALVEEVERGDSAPLRALARQEAERLYRPAAVGAAIARHLGEMTAD